MRGHVILSMKAIIRNRLINALTLLLIALLLPLRADGHWAEQKNSYLYKRGIIENRIAPDEPVSREMFIVCLGRLYEQCISRLSSDTGAEILFYDVDSESKNAGYIHWAYEAGIIKGTGSGLFLPEMCITRQEAAVMLLRFAGYADLYQNRSFYEEPEKPIYADNCDIAGWAQEGAAFCYHTGLMTGKEDSIFDAEGRLTNAETAVIICRLINATIAAEPVRVGIIDSGIGLNAGLQYETGYNFIKDNTDTGDETGHGTAVASLVADTAPNAVIIPLKVSASDYTTLPDTVVRAIYYAVDEAECDIINMSCGLPDSEALAGAISYAEQKGVTLIASVGNLGDTYKRSKVYYPAGYDSVIGVGAVDPGGNVSAFSQRNTSVFIVTEGEELKVRRTDGSEGTVSGTSYSAALITGLAAREGFRNPEAVRSYLKTSALDLGSEGYDINFGWGYIESENRE